ncbi:MAG: hypothetical protein ACTJLK_00470 [Anaplasma sp.]
MKVLSGLWFDRGSLTLGWVPPVRFYSLLSCDMMECCGKPGKAFKIVVNADTKKSVKDSVCIESLVLGHKGPLRGAALSEKWDGHELTVELGGRTCRLPFQHQEIRGLMSRMQTSQENAELREACKKLVKTKDGEPIDDLIADNPTKITISCGNPRKDPFSVKESHEFGVKTPNPKEGDSELAADLSYEVKFKGENKGVWIRNVNLELYAVNHKKRHTVRIVGGYGVGRAGINPLEVGDVRGATEKAQLLATSPGPSSISAEPAQPEEESLLQRDGSITARVLRKLASELANAETVGGLFAKTKASGVPGRVLIQEFADLLLSQIDKGAVATIDGGIKFSIKQDPDSQAYLVRFVGKVKAVTHGDVGISITYGIDKEKGPDGSEQYVVMNAELHLGRWNPEHRLPSRVALPEVRSGSLGGLWRDADRRCVQQVLWISDGTLEQKVCSELTKKLGNPSTIEAIFEKAQGAGELGGSLIQEFSSVFLEQIDKSAAPSVSGKLCSTITQDTQNANAYSVAFDGVVGAGARHGKIKVSVAYNIAREVKLSGNEYVIENAKFLLADGESKGEDLWTKIVLPGVRSRKLDRVWKAADDSCGKKTPPAPATVSLWEGDGSLKKGFLDKFVAGLTRERVQDVFEGSQHELDPGKFLVRTFADIFFGQVDRKTHTTINGKIDSNIGQQDPENRNAYPVKFGGVVEAGTYGKIGVSVEYSVAKETLMNGTEQYAIKDVVLYIAKAGAAGGEGLWTSIELPNVRSDNIGHLWRAACRGDDHPQLEVAVVEPEERLQKEPDLWGTDGTLRNEVLNKLAQALGGDQAVKSIFEKAKNKKDLGRFLIQAFVRTLLDQVDKDAGTTISRKITSKFKSHLGVKDTYLVDFEGVVGAGIHGSIKASVAYKVSKEAGPVGKQRYVISDAELYLAKGGSKEDLWAKVMLPEVRSNSIGHIWRVADENCVKREVVETEPEKQLPEEEPSLWAADQILRKEICNDLAKVLAANQVVGAILEKAKNEKDLGKFLVHEFAKVLLKQVDEQVSVSISEKVRSSVKLHLESQDTYFVDFEGVVGAGLHGKVKVSVVYTVSKEEKPDGGEQYIVKNAALYIAKGDVVGGDLWAQVALPDVKSSSLDHVWQAANRDCIKHPTSIPVPPAVVAQVVEAEEAEEQPTEKPNLWGTDDTLKNEVLNKLTWALSGGQVVKTIFEKARNEKDLGKSLIQAFVRTLLDQVDEGVNATISQRITSKFEPQPGIKDAYIADFEGIVGAGAHGKIKASVVYIVVKETEPDGRERYAIKNAELYLANGDSKGEDLWAKVELPGVASNDIDHIWQVADKHCREQHATDEQIRQMIRDTVKDYEKSPTEGPCDIDFATEEKLVEKYRGQLTVGRVNNVPKNVVLDILKVGRENAKQSILVAKSDDDHAAQKKASVATQTQDKGAPQTETVQRATDEQIRMMIWEVSKYHENLNPSEDFYIDIKTEEALITKYRGQLTATQAKESPPAHVIDAIIEAGRQAARERRAATQATDKQIRTMIQSLKKIYDARRSPGSSFPLDPGTEDQLVARYSGELTVGQLGDFVPSDVMLDIFTSFGQAPATTWQIRSMIQCLRSVLEEQHPGEFFLDSETESELVTQYSGKLKASQVENLESLPQYVKDEVLAAGREIVEDDTADAETLDQLPEAVGDRRGVAAQTAMVGSTKPEVCTPGWQQFVEALTNVARVYDADGGVKGANNLLKLAQLGAVTSFGPTKSKPVPDDQTKQENELDEALEQLRRIVGCSSDDSKCVAILHATVNTLWADEASLQRLILGYDKVTIADQKLHLRWLSWSGGEGVHVERHFLLRGKSKEGIQLTATYDVKSSEEGSQVVVGVSNFVLSTTVHKQGCDALRGTGTVEWDHDDPGSTVLYAIKGGQNAPLRDVMHVNTLLNLAVNESLKEHGGAGKLLTYPGRRTVDRSVSPELLREFTENVDASAQSSVVTPLPVSVPLQYHVAALSSCKIPKTFVDQMCASLGLGLQQYEKLSTLSFPVSARQRVKSGVRVHEVYSLKVREFSDDKSRTLSLSLAYDLLEYHGLGGKPVAVLCNFEVTIRADEGPDAEVPDAGVVCGPLHAVSRHPEVLIPVRIEGQPMRPMWAEDERLFDVQDGVDRMGEHALPEREPVPRQIDDREEVAPTVQLWSPDGTFNFVTEFEEALGRDVCLEAFFGWDIEDEYEFHESLILRLMRAGCSEFLSEDDVADFKVEENDTKLSVNRSVDSKDSYRVASSTGVVIGREKVRVRVCYNVARRADGRYTITNPSLSVCQGQGDKWSHLSTPAADGLTSGVDVPFRNAAKVCREELVVLKEEAAGPETEAEIERIDKAEEVGADDEALPQRMLSLQDVWSDFVRGIATILGDEVLFSQLFHAPSVPDSEALSFGEGLALHVVRNSVQKLIPGARVWIDQARVTSEADITIGQLGERNYTCRHKIIINSSACEPVHATLNYTVRKVVASDGIAKGGCVITNASIVVRPYSMEKGGRAMLTTVSIPDMIYEGSSVPFMEAQQIFTRDNMPATTAPGARKPWPLGSCFCKLVRGICRIFERYWLRFMSLFASVSRGVTDNEPQKPEWKVPDSMLISSREPEVKRTNQGKGGPEPKVGRQNGAAPATALNSANVVSMKVRDDEAGMSSSSQCTSQRAPY